MAALISSVSRELVPVTGRGLLLLRGYNRVVVDSRRFIRGLRRRPVAVLYPSDERETVIKSSEESKQRKPDPETQKKHPNRTDGRRSKEKSTKSGQTGVDKSTGNLPRVAFEGCSVREQLDGLRFDRALPGDNRLAKMVSIARSRAFREQEGKVLLEGKRLICDAIAAGASPQMLFFSRVERLQELPLNKLRQASLLKVKYEDLRIWSDLVTPQGVIAIFSKPDHSHLTFPKDLRVQSVPMFLICDQVRDPGSLGTMLRCAAAAGCDRVLLTQGTAICVSSINVQTLLHNLMFRPLPDCVDPWEPKVLRAAMGAHFRLPIYSGLDWDTISEHLPEPVTVHVTDHGSGIVRRLDTDEEICSNSVSEEYTESDSDDSDELSPAGMEQKVYHENWADKNTALVISGDAHGLSTEALQLAKETDGYKLIVPLAKGVERLNSAMMASILLFEGRRQLMKITQKEKIPYSRTDKSYK
ncbi:rRNA methyltransferase 3A, mitochondrial [Bagarius yarrelli]|uniref:rRNA methyltransferase 3A, mitochondrial n=1 Tax=Bagarius yarrelli TaxID=175774 RepID=A0A556V0C2_BAGYA|nr:rRNA methyltransferase 3A, mitochondrial [Bagarius yarrelli]